MSDMDSAGIYNWIVCPECGSKDVDAEFESMFGEPPRYSVQCQECNNHTVGSCHYGLP